jgi:hypothetical protein
LPAVLVALLFVLTDLRRSLLLRLASLVGDTLYVLAMGMVYLVVLIPNDPGI